MKLGKAKTFVVVCAVAGLLGWSSAAVGQTTNALPAIRQVQIGNGIELHYVELGKGENLLYLFMVR
jgi:hypothetical protein